MDKLRKLIREIALKEINWEGEFSDVIKQCISPEKMVDFLNSLLKRQATPSKDREKRDISQPLFHPSSVPTEEGGEVNLDEFIKNITKLPSFIIGTNEKMEKSGGSNEVIVKTGIPALKGIVYDKENSKFYFVNTCPGAKECIIGCYALAGNYVRVEGPVLNSTRVLNLLLNQPEKYKRMMYSELMGIAIKNDATFDGGDKQVVVRFNDSGDFFSKKYLEISKQVIKDLRADGYNVKPYAYTKMGDVANQSDDDFTFNFSQGANKKETEKFKGSKQSVIVKRDLFKDLFYPVGSHFKKDESGRWEFRNPNGLEELKKRIASTYNVDINNLYSYQEYLKRGTRDGEAIDVVVMPGDGDDSAWDKNVRTTYLLEH